MTISLKLTISDESHAMLKQAAELCDVKLETFIVEASAGRARTMLMMDKSMRVANGRAKRRTTHRSSKGSKLYAAKDKAGKLRDIQSYKRKAKGERA